MRLIRPHVRSRAALVAAAASLLGLAAPQAVARAQAVIKVNDSVSVRFGILSQTWADWAENVRQDSNYAQNIFQRRIRLLAGGQIGPHFGFFFETDNPNLGRSGPGFTKSLGSGFITQDAYVEVKPGSSNAFLIDAGLQLVPLCRNCQQSAASLLPLDYGSYSFLESGPTQSSVGRDVGFLAKGYLGGNHVEYRAGVFQGLRGSAGATQVATNSLRGAGRLQINFLEPEAPAYTYAGTYFGKRRVFAVGGGFDAQGDYKAFSGDAFFDHPLGAATGVTLQGNFIRYDGGDFLTALPKQNTWFVEGGLHFNVARITPWAKFESRSFSTNTAAFQDENRLQAGLTYYMMGHNLNWKAAYSRNNFDRLNLATLHQNEFTLQLQGFYY
jgi:hypothetical protein